MTGQEFSMQIRAVAEAFIRMQGDLNKEKRAMERIWKSREKPRFVFDYAEVNVEWVTFVAVPATAKQFKRISRMQP